MSEVERILYILKSLVINYPIIKDRDYRFTKIPLIIVGHGQIRYLVDILKFFEYTKVFNYPSDLCSAQKVIQEGAESIQFFICCSEKQKIELINWIAPMYASGKLGAKDIRGMPVVVTDSQYIDDSDNHFFVISLAEEDLSKFEIEIDDVRPKDEWIAHIVECQDSIKRLAFDDNVKIFCAAASFFIKKNENLDDINGDISIIKGLSIKDEEYHDISGCGQQFVFALQKWQERNANNRLCELPNVDNDTEEHICTTIFYTDEYVYLSGDLFKDITKELVNITTINAIKYGLVKEGILSVDNSNIRNYVVKMYYYREIGQQASKRMHRFVRSKLAPVGEMDFIESFCQI